MCPIDLIWLSTFAQLGYSLAPIFAGTNLRVLVPFLGSSRKSKHVCWIIHDRISMKSQLNGDFLKWDTSKSSKSDRFKIETGDLGSPISRTHHFFRVFRFSPPLNPCFTFCLVSKCRTNFHLTKAGAVVTSGNQKSKTWSMRVISCVWWTNCLVNSFWYDIWLTASTQVGDLLWWVLWWWDFKWFNQKVIGI